MKIFFKYVILIFFSLFFAYAFFPIFFYSQENIYQNENSLVTDQNGEIFFTFPKKIYTYQKNAKFSQVPDLFKNLIIWKEDRNFYKNYGVEIWTKFKIAVNAFFTWYVRRGGSTITEQWIKNKYFVGANRNILQKLREMTVAASMTFFYSKEKIFEDYLNHIYFGNLVYGVETAANFYFKKSIEHLNPVEQIFLISLISDPSVLYDKDFNFTEKKYFYLDIAQKNNWISDLEYEEFYNFKINIENYKRKKTNNIFLLDMIAKELPKNIDPSRGGYIFQTTIDKNWQKKIEDLTLEKIKFLKEKNVHDVGVVVMDGKNGNILSLIGSADPENKKFGYINTVLQKRPIASTIKPFLFFLAFMEGYQPQNVVLDKEKIFPLKNNKVYRVRNFNGHEFGLVTLEKVLANSFNIGCVKLVEKISVEKFWKFLKNIGFDFEKNSDFYGLSIALGTTANSLLNLVENYSVFLNQGEIKIKSKILNKIIDQKIQKTIFENKKNHTNLNFYDKQKRNFAAAEVIRILSDENLRQRSFGFNSIFNNGKYVAYKTGTSTDFHDNFAIGFDQNLIVGVWVGNLNNEKMEVLSGIEGSGPILHEIADFLDMKKNIPKPFHALEISEKNFAFPEDFLEYKK